MPRSTGPAAPAPPLWDLDRCPAGQLAQGYADLQAFVAWLQAQDIPAPSCWYTHGWLVHRLAAMQAWRARAYAPEAHPKDASDWWAVGLAALQRDWEPCLSHVKAGTPRPTPPGTIRSPSPSSGCW